MKLSLRVSLYALVIALLLAGCNNGKEVALVNGEKILDTQLKSRVEQVAVMYGYDLESPDAKEMVSFLEQQVLESLIEEKVIMQAAAEKKLTVSKDEMAAELQKVKAQFPDEKAYQDFLKERKFTEKDIDSFIKSQLTYDKLFDEITKDITQTDQDPQQYYEENKAEFSLPEQVKASNIVVKTEEEAQAVIDRLDKGEDFGALAVELSIDPTAKENKGDIGYFDKDASLVEEFKDAAFALKTGEYTKKPVKTIYGFHIIKVEDRQPAKTRTFDEVKSELEQRFLMEAKNEKFNTYLDELMGKAAIERKLPEPKPEEEQNPEQGNGQNEEKGGDGNSQQESSNTDSQPEQQGNQGEQQNSK